MRDEGDPLADLIGAWKRLDASPADDDRGLDSETRAAIDWMRDAWRLVEPPRSKTSRRSPSYLRIAASAAAAAVLFAVTIGIARLPGPAPKPHVTAAINRPVATVDFAESSAEKTVVRKGRVRLVILGKTAASPAEEMR